MNKENADGIRELIENFKRDAVEEYKREHGIGWIPCSERMPEERNSIFSKFKNTRNWKNWMFEKTSSSVIVTTKYKDGTILTGVDYTIDGVWNSEINNFIKGKIIAWMPLPDPYTGE